VVDAVHGLSHIPIDVDALDADIVFFSAYKIFGPHVGVMVIKDQVLERIRFHKLAPGPPTGYGKAELGTQNMEAIAGLSAALDFVSSFGAEGGTLRNRLTTAIGGFARYEEDLTAQFVSGLNDIAAVSLARAPETVPKTSTVAFTVTGVAPDVIAAACAADHVYINHGDFYARTLAERTHVAATGGWIRVGISPYHDEEDIRRALDSLERAIDIAVRT